jgi:hypothetical protein
MAKDGELEAKTSHIPGHGQKTFTQGIIEDENMPWVPHFCKSEA